MSDVNVIREHRVIYKNQRAHWAIYAVRYARMQPFSKLKKQHRTACIVRPFCKLTKQYRVAFNKPDSNVHFIYSTRVQNGAHVCLRSCAFVQAASPVRPLVLI